MYREKLSNRRDYNTRIVQCVDKIIYIYTYINVYIIIIKKKYTFMFLILSNTVT